MKKIFAACLVICLITSMNMSQTLAQKPVDINEGFIPARIDQDLIGPPKRADPPQELAVLPQILPDLTVSGGRVLYMPSVRGRSIMVPIEVNISNVGDIPATNFNVVANVLLYPSDPEAFQGYVPRYWNFYVAGEMNYRQSEYELADNTWPEIKYSWCGIVCDRLEPGETRTYTGAVYYRNYDGTQYQLHGRLMDIEVYVNTACPRESGMSDDLFIRIREKSYNNNNIIITYRVP